MGHIIYGPYLWYPPGNYEAVFEISLERAASDGQGRLVIEVTDDSFHFLAQRFLSTAEGLPESCRTLAFEVTGRELFLEFRIFADGFTGGTLRFSGVNLKRVDCGTAPNSFQSGNLARYQFTHKGEVRTAASFGPDYVPELERVITSFAPSATTFLEWGTGVSTILLAEIAGQRSGSFISIDDNAEYARSAISGIRPPAIVRSLVADLTGPTLNQTDAGFNYSSLPLSLGMDFDLIYIDGRRRMECANTAFMLSSPATVVVLHDYRRTRYQAVKVLFEVIEDGPQFRVMKVGPELLAATAVERGRLIRQLRAAGSR